jgi:hypothetical protein
MTDHTTIRINDRFRNDAIACLVQLVRDESAPAASRAQAATKLLEYSVGRPVSAKPITMADIEAMSEETRQQLLHALLVHYRTALPGEFQALLTAAVNEALVQQATITANSLAVKVPPFTRRAPIPALPSQQPLVKPPAAAVHAEGHVPSMQHSGEADLPHETALKSISENAAEPPATLPASTINQARRPRIGDIPIDAAIADYIKPRSDHSVKGNGTGPDYATAFRDYQIAASRCRNGQS